jgi:hypothetical protein
VSEEEKMSLKHCEWCSTNVTCEEGHPECYYCGEFICKTCTGVIDPAETYRCPTCISKGIILAETIIYQPELTHFTRFLLKSFNTVNLHLHKKFRKIKERLDLQIMGVREELNEQIMGKGGVDIVKFFNERQRAPVFNRKLEKCELVCGICIPFGIQFENRKHVFEFLWTRWIFMVGSPQSVVIILDETDVNGTTTTYHVTLYELLTNSSHYQNFLRSFA